MDIKIFSSEEEIKEAKSKLNNLIDFINSEDYFNLPDNKKNLINNVRSTLEAYLNSMASLQYDIDGVGTFNPLMPLLFSMFMSGSSFSNTSYLKDQLNVKDVEVKHDGE